MSCLGNQISPEQWVDYLEGKASAADRVRLELHVAECSSCREVRDHLSLVRGRLLKAARAEKARPVTTGSATARIWDGVRFRIRRVGQLTGCAARPEHPAMDLRQLRSILVSMCGEATAEGALHEVSARSGAALDPHFARNLGSIVEAMCGTRAARFVEQAAQAARGDMVA